MKKYDLIIIGAGPAGLTAGIYASRYRLSSIVIGALAGGTINDAHQVCNFPTEKSIGGRELAAKIFAHCQNLGGEVLTDEVIVIKKGRAGFTVATSGDKKINGRTLILATGNQRRKLNLFNEDKFLGRGLSYCAACDGMFYRDKTVAVIGGSDAANTASLHLVNIAQHVYQIYRGEKLRGEPAWVENVLNNKKITVVYKTNIIKLCGQNKLEKIILDKSYRNKKELTIDGLFVEIGSTPNTDLARKIGAAVDNNGYIRVDEKQRTNVDGVWAAGDATTGSNKFQQVVTACAEGAVAVADIFQFLQN